MKNSNRIRQIPLLAGEEVVQLFAPNNGVVDRLPEEGELLVLTNQRLITFTQEDGRGETRMSSLEKIEGVSMRGGKRSAKALYQGITLIIVGILVYLVLGTFSTGVAQAAILGGVIAFLGVLFASRYIAWEQRGEVTFQVGAWQLTFPCYSSTAASQIYQVAHRYFQLKGGEDIEERWAQAPPVADLHPLDEPECGLRASDAMEEDLEVTSPAPGTGLHPGPDPAPGPGSDESSHRLLP